MIPTLDDSSNHRELAELAAQIDPPALSPDMLARIMARRQDGERIALPTEHAREKAARGRGWRVVAVASATAACVIVAIVLQHNLISPTRDASALDALSLASADSVCGSYGTAADSSELRHLMVSAFGVAVACGAEPVPALPVEVDGTQIVPATLMYGSRTVTDNAWTSEHQRTTYSISRRVWKGIPALLVVRTGPLITRVSLDSLTVSLHDLVPLHWASWYPTQTPVGSMHADFDSSSVAFTLAGRVDTSGRFPYSQAAGRLPPDWMRALVIPSLRLAAGWHGTIQLAAPYHPHVHKEFTQSWATMQLQVVGRETIEVPAGRYDCWKLRAGPPNYASFIWVSTRNHFVVQSRTVHRFNDTEFDDTSYLERAEIASQ